MDKSISITNYYSNRPSVEIAIKSVGTVGLMMAILSYSCLPKDTMLKWSQRKDCYQFLCGCNLNYSAGCKIFHWADRNILPDSRYDRLVRIDKIGELQDGWNGKDANSFSKELIGKAKGIIMKLIIQPDVFPTARDSIQFEYEKKNGDYLEFELFESGILKMFLYEHTGNSKTRYISENEMNEIVGDFYGCGI